MMTLERSFFQTDPVTAAHDLLGWRLCFEKAEGMIIETEAYARLGDEACHTWKRPSTRAFIENHPAGVAYVYLNYGMHWLFNIVVKGETPEKDGFVLVRALAPLVGISLMRERRYNNLNKNNLIKRDKDLCNGPGKLTQALGINGTHHGVDVLLTPSWSFKKTSEDQEKIGSIIATPRIGISLARERPWRFVMTPVLYSVLN